MANNMKQSTPAVNAAADAVCALANGGTLDIYDGAQPASADTAVTSQTLLASLDLSATAFGDASDGAADANAISSEAATDSGDATWFRVSGSGGAAVFDGSVGSSDADLVLNATAIAAGATVSVSSLTYTQPQS